MAIEMKYFVLKPRGDGPHAIASRQAMLAYADAITCHDPKMAVQLIDWVHKELQPDADSIPFGK